jgi:hypothetical protein
MSELDNIGIECGTDKSSLIHNYLVKYEKYLPFNRNNNVKILEIGSQYDGIFLKQIIEKYGEFDLILDDGSHMNNHVIFSFKNLFSSVKSGGAYIVEDC